MLKKSFYTSVIAGDISTIAGLGGGVNLVIWLLQLGESVFGDRHQFMQLQAADALADFFCNLCTNKRICFINPTQSQCHQSTQFHITTSWS
jgi:hypothetical protein